jgi:uncharacterized protein
MVAHSGGPPLAIYLLPLGTAKEIYAGTASLFFAVGNAMKVIPWLFLAKPANSVWARVGICVRTVPLGIWAGWTLHLRLDQRQLYRACYGLLVIAFELLWAGVSGYWS